MLNILVSSLLFAITFFIPTLSLYTMTTFLMPLYKMRLYNLKNKQLFLQGFTWGFIVFGSYWCWITILFKNQSLHLIGIIFWIILTIWCSLFSGIWIYYFYQWPIISTVIFFTWVTKGILILLGKLEGIPSINPLVLLSEYQFIIYPLYYLQDAGMFTIIFGIQYFIASQSTKIKIVYILLLLILWPLSLIQENKNNVIRGVAVVTPWWYNKKKGAMFDGYRLAHDLCNASQQKNIKFILTPESTFCFDVNEYKRFISIWCNSANNIPILLGAHVINGLFPHNAILLLHKDKIKRFYFKQHKMPFLERTVWFEHFLKKTILSCRLIPEVKNDFTQNDLFNISGKIYQLYMCSEFFMQTKKAWGYPILLVWNDHWLSCNYMKRLSFLFITYFKLKYHVDVYHIATSGKTNINS